MFIEYSEDYIQSNFGGLNFLKIKSPFYNSGVKSLARLIFLFCAFYWN